MRIAYFDCFSGISGDMTIAAFLDTGLSFEKLKCELKKLKIAGYELRKSKVKRNGIAGTKFDVIVPRSNNRSHRTLREILALIEKSSLPRSVKDKAAKIFRVIGKAEAKVHGLRAESDVRFHELGGIDSIIDIVGTAIALEELGIDEIYSSTLNQGRGFACSQHGILPVPAPATAEILKGVPTAIAPLEAELVTPTGAAILKALAKGFGAALEMRVSHIGYGAGTAEFTQMPNMLRVLIGETRSRPHPAFKKDKITVIETNIDDMNPQIFEYLFGRLFAEGALDVYTTAIQMKKTRPAFKLTVLAEGAHLDKICDIIFSETTAIGLRYYEAERFKLERKSVKTRTKYGNIDVKVSKGPGDILTISPEYEKCVKLAKAKKVPLKRIYDEAKSAVKV